jgi:hypothetical protein
VIETISEHGSVKSSRSARTAARVQPVPIRFYAKTAKKS